MILERIEQYPRLNLIYDRFKQFTLHVSWRLAIAIIRPFKIFIFANTIQMTPIAFRRRRNSEGRNRTASALTENELWLEGTRLRDARIIHAYLQAQDIQQNKDLHKDLVAR